MATTTRFEVVRDTAGKKSGLLGLFHEACNLLGELLGRQAFRVAARLDGDEETPDDIVRENPWVTVEMVLAAVAYAKQVPQVEHPDGKPWRNRAVSKTPT